METRVDPKTILDELHVTLRRYTFGNHYTTCPKCSHLRKKFNQKKPCLSVKIDEKGCVVHCIHCDWIWPNSAERIYPQRQASGVHRKEGPDARHSDGYGRLQRNVYRRIAGKK